MLICSLLLGTGQAEATKRMNFQTASGPSPRAHFWKIVLQFFSSKNVRIKPFIKIQNLQHKGAGYFRSASQSKEG